MKQENNSPLGSFRRIALGCLALCLGLLPLSAGAQRLMENLGRGVVAVRSGSDQVFVSWRLLGLDPEDIRFNVYRSADGGPPAKLNGSPLDAGCNFTDTTADLSQDNAYHVRPVIGGVEQDAASAYTLPANATEDPLFRLPLQPLANHYVHFAWVGDLDGDGEYDYVVNRLGSTGGQTQKLEAYKRDGTFLWRADFGPNSVDPEGVYPSAAAIDAGQWDGVTVYDIDSDGRAEVIVKSADGVTFGDGTTLSHGDDVTQFISVLDGMTGAELDRELLPNPWRHRALGTCFGIGYPDGQRPSLIIHAKNRAGGSGTPFNVIQSAWDFRDGEITNRWSIQWDASSAPPVAHQMRIVDLDGDGRDDLLPGMHAVGSDGELLYNLGDQGVVHGDRFHIGDLDPDRPGLEGYGIQQDNPNGLTEYFHDAATGEILWSVNLGPPGPDAARGTAADIDPAHPGYEVWSFYGIRNASGTVISTSDERPWPNFRIWWDGDVRSENLNETMVEKWDPVGEGRTRLLTGWRSGAEDTWRGAPTFYGDIIGDWREEIIFEHNNRSELLIFTTPIPTDVRLYTPAHNPAYRNGMTVKGYMQSHMVDYYLGEGMADPPRPDIVYVSGDTEAPAVPTGLTGAVDTLSVELAWDDQDDDDLAGFRVHRSRADGGPYTPISELLESSDYVDTTAINGIPQYYVVSAVDLFGNESGYSNQVEATPDSELLVLRYEFDAGLQDLSGRGNHGEAQGSPGQVAGPSGLALELDGADDRVTLPAGVANLSDLTIAAWVRWNGGDDWQRIVDLGNDTDEYLFLTPHSGGDTLRFAITTGGSTADEQLEAPPLAVGQWTHVAVTLAGDLGTLYVDGAVADTGTITIDPGDFRPANNHLGESQYSDPRFNGAIDDFRIYSHALDNEEILELTDPVLPAAPPEPLAYYRFEEGSAGTAVVSQTDTVVDSGGGDDPLRASDASSAPAYSGDTPFAVVPQTGEPNLLSLLFDGGDHLFQSVSGPLLTADIGDFTAEAWVRFSGLDGYQTILGRDDTAGSTNGQDGNPQALFYLSKSGPNNAFRVEASTSGGDMISHDSDVIAEVNRWYHLAAVGDMAAGTLTLFVDGAEAGSASGFDGLYDPPADNSWTIGRGQWQGNPADEVEGFIDEVRVTAEALTPGQFLRFDLDTDDDGLLDPWELAYFQDLDQTASGDPDSDGADNLTEQADQTPPNISGTIPTPVLTVDGGIVEIDWPADHIGWRLLHSSDLADPWREISGSHRTDSISLPIESLGERGFFKLEYP